VKHRMTRAGREVAVLLWSCTALFAARVIGQFEALVAAPAWLPDMDAWYSGLLPYYLLLPVQILLLMSMTVVAWNRRVRTGRFAMARPRLARESESETTNELLGYEISPKLYSQLRALNADSLPLTARYETTVLADADDLALKQWTSAQLARQLPLQLLPFKHPMVWTSDPHPNNAMVPAEALQRLLAEIGN